MEIEWVDARGPDGAERAAERAAAVLAAGGLVIHPTETVYGLGGDGSPASNARVARVKGRGLEHGLILLVPDADAARRVLPGLRWPPAAEALARRYWPGPLSIVVPCDDPPPGLAGPGGGVALRATPDPVAAAIVRRAGRLTSTSANRHGEPPPGTAAEAAACVRGRPDLDEEMRGCPVLVVDGGPRGAQPPSTVVSVLGRHVRVLREGPISRDAIERALAEAERDG